MRLNRIGYLIKSGFKSIFSHGLMSVATVTIIIACLIIMGSFSLLVVNINANIDEMEKDNEVVAYVDDSCSEEETAALKDTLESVENVSSADFMSAETAYENFKAEHPESNFDVLDAGTLRDRYVIHLEDISLMKYTKADLEKVDGIAKVRAYLEYADAFVTMRNIVGVVSLVLVVILMVVSFFIMSNTVKLTTFTRRKEIGIMKMVGASNAFIRCPFIIEGVVLGLIGGAIAFLLQWGVYELVTGKVVAGITGTFVEVVPFMSVMLPVLTVFLAVGVLVGAVGGSTAIRNYLKV